MIKAIFPMMGSHPPVLLDNSESPKPSDLSPLTASHQSRQPEELNLLLINKCLSDFVKFLINKWLKKPWVEKLKGSLITKTKNLKRDSRARTTEKIWVLIT